MRAALTEAILSSSATKMENSVNLHPYVHSSAQIHPTAIVHAGARIGADCVIGPYCVLGPDVDLGERNRLESHVILEGRTRLGVNNHLFSFVVIGSEPQDRHYAGQETGVTVGDGNIIREYVTISRATRLDQPFTRLGSGAMLMAGAHIGHDCQVEDGVTMANGVALAGHAQVAPQVVFGGLAGVHQFVRIGRLAMVAAGAMVSQDVPPFCLVQGDRARLRGLNRVGLVRAGLTEPHIRSLRRAYRLLFRESLTREAARAELLAQGEPTALVAELLAFLQQSVRGVCRVARASDS